MGTVVFPDAQVKFFVTAPAEIRAARRFSQLQGTPQQDTIENITAALKERDHRDSTSAVGTTKQAQGAILIDNSKGTLEQTLETMLQVVQTSRSSR
jgi:cytidylate kinase